jgi:hypothetical protein
VRKVIEIFDVFEVKDRGIVVAGVNAALDLLAPDQVRDLVGKEVTTHSTDGRIEKHPVIDVQTTSSILNQKNIFILLPLTAKTKDIKVGAVVFSADPTNTAGFD